MDLIPSFFAELNRRLAAVPGVQSASLAVIGILEDRDWESTVNVEGYTAKPGEDMNPQFNAISPAYFATLGIPLLEGRDFTDRHHHLPSRHTVRILNVIIVNQKLAKQYFGNHSAVGRHIGFGNNPGSIADREIIGVVKDF
jgi:MacB-like periplasmic core domain